MSRAQDLFDRLRIGGRTEIEALVDTRASEELFLDFKRSADSGSGRKLHTSDRTNYGKALSGFANSEGGVIVWGVDCRPGSDGADVAQEYHPLEDAPGFASRLEAATSGCTVPACPGVEHIPVPIGEGTKGFVVSHIPQSYLAPHQCVGPVNYFMRAGSSFLPVPHGVLQGLFGRRRTAPIFPMWAIEPPILGTGPAATSGSVRCTVGILLSSFGPGVVRDIFLNVYASPPGPGSTLAYEFPDPTRWSCHTFTGRAYAVSVDGFKLAPEVMAMPIKIQVDLRPPFLDDWHMVLLLGHAESATSRFEVRVTAEVLASRVSGYIARAGRDYDKGFVGSVLGLDQIEPPEGLDARDQQGQLGGASRVDVPEFP